MGCNCLSDNEFYYSFEFVLIAKKHWDRYMFHAVISLDSNR